MTLFSILGHAKAARDTLPDFIREIEDIRGVRVVRLRGPVGMQIGQQAHEADELAARSQDAFSQSLLFDFKGTTGWDFATVAYLVKALGRRMAAHARVGLINAPPQLIAELDIAKIEALFRIFDSEEQALAELSGSGSAG